MSDTPLRAFQGRSVAVSGTGGFVGRHLVQYLGEEGYQVFGFSRHTPEWDSREQQHVQEIIGDLNTLDIDSISKVCDQVDVFYHLAGRAHRPSELADDSCLELFRNDNVKATEKAYLLALALGARRFVYLSSIKVLGDTSAFPLSPGDTVNPGDVYARSKCEAEVMLQGLQLQHSLAVTVVRPPLIYGPHVAGNFEKLLGVASGWFPLPLLGACAPRSMLSVYNLCDLLVRCIPEDDLGYRVLHVCDDKDVSVVQLLTAMSRILKTPVHLFYVPERYLEIIASGIGRSTQFARLFDPLQVDDSHTRELFSWSPPQSFDAALKETVDCWMSQH